MERQNEEMEIDLLEVFFYLKKRIWIILASFAVCAVVGFLFTTLFVSPKYTASTRMYVLNRSNGESVNSSDYQISNYMVSDYTVLITGRNVTDEVISRLNLDMSSDELANAITVSSPTNTRILQIDVTAESSLLAADIANTVREVAALQIKEIMAVDAVNLVYAAEVPRAPASPNVLKNTVLAAAVGLVAAIGVLVLICILDDSIRTEEDVEKYLGLSVLGVIPVSAEFEKIAIIPKQAKQARSAAKKKG